MGKIHHYGGKNTDITWGSEDRLHPSGVTNYWGYETNPTVTAKIPVQYLIVKA